MKSSLPTLSALSTLLILPAFSQIYPLPLKNISSLLNDDYQNLEAGFGIASDGLSVVAASTYMRGVTGEMIDWWFDSLSHTDWYARWHPRDHVFADWVPSAAQAEAKAQGTLAKRGSFVGGHHLVKEYIGGELQSLNISFRDPGLPEYFGPNWRADFARTNHSTVAVGRVSFYDFALKLSTPVGHLMHLIHDEADGVRMRSRFWLGDLGDLGLGIDLGAAAMSGGGLVPPYLTRGLQKHATEEMAILATILPDLWRRYSVAGKGGEVLPFEKGNPNGTTFAGPFSV